jgi:hypothetical protein
VVEEQHESDEEDEAPEATTSKRRKVGSSKSKQVEEVSKPVKAKKARPPAARPDVYKKGAWNPNVELVTEEANKSSRTLSLESGCCLLCNNRSLLRAAWTGNKELLTKCIRDTQNISNCCAQWGAETRVNALQILLEKGDPELLQALLSPEVKPAQNETADQARRDLFQVRKAPPPFLLSLVQQGRVSNMAYGGHIR